MPNEENILEFPQAAVNIPSPPQPPLSYHYCAFRIGKDGSTTWFDGVVQLNVVILTQEHYLGLKKTLAEHYDVPESNFVISSLTRLDAPRFDASSVKLTAEEVTAN